MSFVPSDDMLLKDITKIQATQGADIGIQKIYDYMKAEHPLWIFGIKRLRTIRKTHNLAPHPPDRENVQVRSGSLEDANNQNPNILQMHLTFEVLDGRHTYPYAFDKPFPRIFCEGGADKNDVLAIFTRIIDLCESEIIISRAWRCSYCGEPATDLYSSPLVNLSARPPSVVCEGSQPVCSASTECYRLAQKASTDAFKIRHSRGMPSPEGSSESWMVR